MSVAFRSVATRPFYLHRELFGEAFVAMARSLGGELRDDQVREAVDRQYAATIDAAVLRSDCLDTLGRLRDRGLHVQIVSNIDEEQLAGLVARLGLESAVDAATSSEAARSCKPDPGIYRFALERSGCSAEEVLFVGDTPAHDIAGPQSVGMSTALLVAVRRPAPDHRRFAGLHRRAPRAGRRDRRPGDGRMNEPVDALRDFLDDRLGDTNAIDVEPMVGGGSCEIFAIDRGSARWVLRRAPSHASSATVHDVLREFRILDAIKDEAVSIARPLLACDDPAVFGAPFYVMDRIDGVPVRSGIPDAWSARPVEQAHALEQLVDALVAIHAVDWRACGLRDLAHTGPYLERQMGRWLSQLDSYGGRPLPPATRVASWLADTCPPDQAPALAHGDYKLDNVLFAESAPPKLLAVVDWEMASIGDPLIDLGVGDDLPSGAGGNDAARRRHEPRVRSRAAADPRVAARTVRGTIRSRRRARSVGTTSSPVGSSPSCWRAVTPSSCAVNRRSRSTSTSASRPTSCSRAR